MSEVDGPPVFGERRPELAYRRRPGAYAVALDVGRVLVVDAAEGRFLPGGALDATETAQEALAREFLEETGHRLVSAEPLGTAHQLIVSRASGEAIEKVGQFFRAEVSADPVAEPSEAGHLAHWIDAEEALATLTEESHRWAVSRAVSEAAGSLAGADPGAATCECPPEVDPRIARYFDRRNLRRREGIESYVTGNVTRRLLAALMDVGPAGRTVLEPGCGPGALIVELLGAGAAGATGVDLSAEAIEYARQRSSEAGVGDRTKFQIGDAARLPLEAHDWVVLDKVICCYAHASGLLANTVRAARLVYAFAVPASYGWRGVLARLVGWFEDATSRLRGRPCPGYVHDVGYIERLLVDAGFRGIRRENVGLWHLAVFGREPQLAASSAGEAGSSVNAAELMQ